MVSLAESTDSLSKSRPSQQLKKASMPPTVSSIVTTRFAQEFANSAIAT